MKKIGLLLVIALLLITGCSEDKDDADSEELSEEEQEILEESDEPAAEEQEKGSPEKQKLIDKGDFKVIYGETQSTHYAQLNELIKNSQVFENVAESLNKILVLQEDFPIYFKECGFVNAYYNPSEKEIVMCDELLEDLAFNFAYFVSTEDELDVAITDATYFILYHELGHGLIDIYNITYSGREEDVADQLSTIVLVSLGGEEGARAAITGANHFYIASMQKDVSNYPFWDEHALDQQRYYNILCWVYGSNPEKYSDFVGDYGLPMERAVRCQREYGKMSQFWDIAIYPFLQEEIKEAMKQEG